MRQWIAKKKLALVVKWARSFGLFLCRIENVGGTEYLVDTHGSYRKLATKRRGE